MADEESVFGLNDATNNENSQGQTYQKSSFWCCWRKGNRVSQEADSLSIKVGGENHDKKTKASETNRIKSTKYTVFTFLPLNLIEQFRRIANFYFLCMTVISIVIDSPVSPLTSLVPLVFVISVTAAKQGYENYLRYRADNMVNYSLVTVLRAGVEMDIRCQDIRQGDIVRTARDCDMPCDMVLLKSSDENGRCYVTTANLDGETNLKTMVVPKGLPNLSEDKLHTLGRIECELPRTDLYTFNGRIELAEVHHRHEITSLDGPGPEHHVLPLMAENLLLRGSRVKNTEWAIGCAVYIGQNTKLALNSKMTSNKMSSSEGYINKYLVFFLVLLIAIVTVSFFMKRYNDRYHQEHNFYLGEYLATYRVSQFLQDFFSFLILFNYLIPISLYVTIEMAKFLGGFYLEWDHELFDEETDQPCIVNTSDINEELGQVSLLFSDKTGTLTKNVMIFQQCSINGRKYTQKGRRLQETGRSYALKINECSRHVYNFFEALAVCHTVQVAGDYTNEVDDPEADQGETEDDEDQNVVEPNNNRAVRNFSLISEELESSVANESTLDVTGLVQLKNLGPRSRAPVAIPSLCDINSNDDVQGSRSSPRPLSASQLREPRSNENVAVRPASETVIRRPSNSVFAGLPDNRIHPISLQIPPFRRSPSNASSNRSSRPQSLVESIHSDVEEPGLRNGSTNLFQNGSNGQLNASLQSMELKRAISAYEEKSEMDRPVKTHRRTQSHIPPGMNNNKNNGILALDRGSVRLRRNRSSIRSTAREFYAAPSYTTASLLDRQESVMKHEEVVSFIRKMDYQASSPDEKALVEACARMGLVFVGDDADVLHIKLRESCVKRNVKSVYGEVPKEEVVKYTRLGVLEFTSDRKRMSVIVRDAQGQVWLYTKGAESHVLPLCTRTASGLIISTQRHINEFAKQGLRTLAVARRKLTQIEFANFRNELIQANNSLTDRVTKVEECQRKIETGLELLGATAVEDALQDDVRDTLESLRKAGIKVWVLTGDKVETALNIALSCGHIPDNAYRYFVTDCTTMDQVQRHFDVFSFEMFRAPEREYALLIDGASLAIALKDLKEVFRDVSIKCRAVLCCRLSPLQKCEVVQLMKTVDSSPVTAAIGDGANDVSMIQEAHVGLGIVGKEGRQAARCADYAFAKFCMVKKLLLVHGHYFSTRLAILVLYFFYKNLIFMGIQFFFQIHSMFSSQSVYDSVFLTLYNVFYTSLPVLLLSLTEKPYKEETLMKEPSLYQKVAGNKQYAWKYFLGWMFLAVYHSSIVYVFCWVIWGNNPAIYAWWPSTANFACFGTIMIHNVVVLANLKLLLEAIYRSYIFIATILLSIFGFMGTTFIYNLFNLIFVPLSRLASCVTSVDPLPSTHSVNRPHHNNSLGFTSSNYDGDMLQVYNNLLSSMTFWGLSLLILVAAFIPDFTMFAGRAIDIKIGHIFPGGAKYRQTFFQRRTGNNVESTYL
ncbi:phospholipid-transporting ATPase IF isoform X2 [Uranotaenia lowii]|uniref:phospholipid-transporting ATPase IF isoform X2 n=1 Tax=Uranotaenia lowii TaxID=190385 RepID=UPI00247AFE3A|nr:phospholipid-transporting ATPase IF isoform X2 [Uranotaenia lowii]